MVAVVLSEWSDVRTARECAAALAQAAGVPDPEMVAQAVAEIGNNCLEHRDGTEPVVLAFGCRRGRLVLRAENACRRRPTWQTAKPVGVDGFREGGYGLRIVRALARDARFTWRRGARRVRLSCLDLCVSGQRLLPFPRPECRGCDTRSVHRATPAAPAPAYHPGGSV